MKKLKNLNPLSEFQVKKEEKINIIGGGWTPWKLPRCTGQFGACRDKLGACWYKDLSGTYQKCD